MSTALKVGHSIDLENRTVWLSGETDQEMYNKLSIALSVLGPGKLVVVLNTPGGCVYHALAIYDLIKSRENSVIICEGHVMSSGVIILQAAKYRLSRPNCQFLVHYGHETNSSGTEVAHNQKLTTRMVKLLKSRLSVSDRTVRGWLQKETYFDVDHAIKVGMLDGEYKGEI